MFIDLDRFKLVNDRHGHAAGDLVLATAAQRLRDSVRGVDEVGRIGGDEFLVICPNVDNAAQAVEVADRLAGLFGDNVDVGASTAELRASIGVAWTNEATDADSLVAQADSAMYNAKRNGTGRVTLYTG